MRLATALGAFGRLRASGNIGVPSAFDVRGRSGFPALRGVLALLGVLAALPSAAGELRSLRPLPTMAGVAPTGGVTRPPIGWIDFCKEDRSECGTDLGENVTVKLDAATWRKISAINRRVNREIEAITDEDHWGRPERWSLPADGKGDCEDYALRKRQLFAQSGLPRRALLMTVVIDETGGGHAILTVRTDRGDFILDNRRSAILAWNETDYRYVKREGQDGRGWVTMGDPAPAAVATAAP